MKLIKNLGCAAVLLAVAMAPAMVSAQDKGTVVYLLPSLGDEFQTESRTAIENMIGGLGYEVISMDAQNRSDHQLNQIDTALLMNPVALVIAAVDFDSVIPGIEKAREAGVKVIAYDRPITNVELDFTSVAGTYEIGEVAAHEVQTLLKALNGSVSGTVLQITGDPGDMFSVDIQTGFDENMAEFSDVTIITKPAMGWEASNAADIADDQLLVNTDIDLIFTHAGHLAGAVSSVLEAKGQAPGETIQVTAVGLPQGLDLIRQGWVSVDVEQPLYAQVAGIAMFLDLVVGGGDMSEGSYDVLGLKSTLTHETWGWNLKIPGAAARKDNVETGPFWGNLNAPTDPIIPVQ